MSKQMLFTVQIIVFLTSVIFDIIVISFLLQDTVFLFLPTSLPSSLFPICFARIRNNQGQFISVAQSCPTLCDPMDNSMPGFSVRHQLPEPTHTHVHMSVMPSSHLILCHPLLFLPSIFPSTEVFSNESVLCIRWSEYWSFSFSISPFNE